MKLIPKGEGHCAKEGHWPTIYT